MKNVTITMINEFSLRKLRYDFAGYSFQRVEQLSFHHLIISHRDSILLHVPEEGYVYYNGAILTQSKSSDFHDYLHIIQKYDHDIFVAITNELIEENKKGCIDIANLKRIRDLLVEFERKHKGERTKNGYPLIRESFVEPRILK